MRALLVAMSLACTSAHAVTPAVSGGRGHSVGLHSDGTVRAWGTDGEGQLGSGRVAVAFTPNLVSAMPTVRAGGASLSAGSGVAFAIAADGILWAWGFNTFGNLGNGTNVHRPTPGPVSILTNVVSASTGGGGHSLAVTADGSVWSWGRNTHGQIGRTGAQALPGRVEGVPSAIAVSAGAVHSLALAADGTVWAWGDNADGQLGDGTTTSRSTPRRVGNLFNIIRIEAGSYYNLALRSDGAVWAWGYNDGGQIGDGTTTTRLAPVQVPGIVARSISAGGPTSRSAGSQSHAVGIDGSVWRWGVGSPQGPTQQSGYSEILEISAGNLFSVALRADGSVWTAGNNNVGQLGRGANVTQQPRQVEGLPPIAAISAGEAFVLVASTDGRLFSWGVNNGGQLGVEQVITRTTPVRTVSIDSVTKLSSGARGNHVLALRSDGTVRAWGSNVFGNLAAPGYTPSSVPLAVAGLSQVIDVAAGGGHSVAVRADGTVWTWGDGSHGQLGRAAELGTQSVQPGQVTGLPPIVKIAAGSRHTMALAADGRVWAWGANDAQQLGVATSEVCADPANAAVTRPCATRPLQLAGISNVVALSAGIFHTLAVRSDGTVWAWGNNRNGALGDGTTGSRQSPAPVTGLSDVTSVAAGGTLCDDCGAGHSLALKNDGTVWAWGENAFGQLGDGTRDRRLVPVRVEGLGSVISITAGDLHSVAVRRDGTVMAWGMNNTGQVGDGTFAQRTRPVVVVRENGAGSLDTNDWFLDLDPAAAAEVSVDKAFGVVSTGSAEGAQLAIDADIRFRSRDVGTTGGVYVFALAPETIVRPSTESEPPFVLGKAVTADGKKADVQCVLAQLTASGQLQAVSAASLQAYVTGVLSGQGQAVSIVNGVPAANIGGATLFVGYGPSASAMLNGGSNRSVATLTGAVRCEPQPPQTGWWWNPAESGRGYSIEARGNRIFFAAFHYDTSGRSTWHVANGQTSLDGSLFSGDLLSVSGGQTLGGPYTGFPRITTAGALTLAFNDATHGTMVWPGGAVPIERFNIVPNGLATPPHPNQPESGWWWNEQEAGRGFFIEWQNGWADVAGYMYDDAGNPVWYLSVYATPDPRSFSGNWWAYANGQSMMAPYRPATRINDNVAPVTITFTGADTAVMTLPNNRTTNLRRHRF